MDDELTEEISQTIKEQGPITLLSLCEKLHLWPRSGISRRLQHLRKQGDIVFDKDGWVFNETN